MLFNPANIHNIPQELRDIPRWTCWRAVPSTDGKTSKIPVNPHNPAQNGSTKNAQCWGTFSEALGASVASQGTLGIGFVFTNDDAIFGLDLDGCVTADGLTPHTQEVLRQFKHTYAEFSPSGAGIHVYGYGNVPQSFNRDKGELYGTGRYFTVTGNPVPDTASCLAECPPTLMNWLIGSITQSDRPLAKTPQQGSYHDIDIDENDESPPPYDMLQKLSDRYAAFYPIWTRTGKKYPSVSEEEMAIGRYAVSDKWSDRAIYALLRQWRMLHNLDAKHLTAYKLTLFNLHSTAAEQPDGAAEVFDDSTARSILKELLPLPLTRFVSLGKTDGNYRAILADGQQINLGPFTRVEKQATWRQLVSEQTQLYLPVFPAKKWTKIMSALMAIAEYETNDDGSENAETLQWIHGLTKNILHTSFSYEILRHDASFTHDGVLHLTLNALLQHVHTVFRHTITRSQLAQRVRLLGWKSTEFILANDNGTAIKKTYWHPEKEEPRD